MIQFLVGVLVGAILTILAMAYYFARKIAAQAESESRVSNPSSGAHSGHGEAKQGNE